MFIDSHCHLDFDEFSGEREAVLNRAAAAGIEGFITIGIRVRDFARVLAVTYNNDNVFCTVGTLPHYADEERDVTAAELVAFAEHEKVVGIGEAGLDRFFGTASWEAQLDVFRTHIDAARQTQLPLVIHSVREDDAMTQMLEEESRKGAFPMVMHAFSGGASLVETALSLGAYVSFSGLVTYPENIISRAIAADVPADRLLIETDAPSLAPMPFRDSRNEPALIVHTAEMLAGWRSVSVELLGEQTSANARRLFKKFSV